MKPLQLRPLCLCNTAHLYLWLPVACWTSTGRAAHTHTSLALGRAWACRLLSSFNCWLRSFMWRVSLFAPCTMCAVVHMCVCVLHCQLLRVKRVGRAADTWHRCPETTNSWRLEALQLLPERMSGRVPGSRWSCRSRSWSWSCCSLSSIRLADARAIQMKFQCVDCCVHAALSSGWGGKNPVLCVRAWAWHYDSRSSRVPVENGVIEMVAVDLSFASRPKGMLLSSTQLLLPQPLQLPFLLPTML